MRTKEALAKETVALNRDEPAPVSRADSPNASEVAADLHRRKGDSAESEGRPLDAVREYQLAAELQQNEPNIFAWGAELLLHRAFEPAIEVFSKGHHLFPHSVRILLGLGIATYDQGDTERGQQFILAACDLNPSDPMPYLFLGKLQEAEGMESPIGTEKYRRLVSLHPENAMAHYYYAVALSKQSSLSENKTVVEVELKKAIELDSALGKAYLQLGIVYCAKKDFPSAIQAFKAAIRTMPSPDEAHYRLAQIYNQTGEIEKAHNEIALFNQSSQERIRTAEVQRHEIQRFVYTLRTPNSSPRSTNDKPK
jgi:tetratricopeptide (TPR) repeat protein